MVDSPKSRTRTRVQSHTTPDDLVPAKTGPSLRAAQRRELLILIGVHWDTETVLAIVREEHSDWPTVTADTVRYHRRQLEAQLAAAQGIPSEPTAAQQAAQAMIVTIAAEQQRALGMGLANKAVRVSELTRLYQRLKRGLAEERPLLDGNKIPVLDDAGLPRTVDVIDPMISKEMRSTLEQIAKEVGGYPTEPVASGVTIINAPGANTTVVMGEAKARLADALLAIEERRGAMIEAEEGLPT